MMTPSLKNTFLSPILLLGMLLLSSCGKQTAQIQSTTSKESTSFKEIETIYENCAVYAAVTKFYFQPLDGGGFIEVSVWNEGMDEYPSPIKLPDNLVDKVDVLEGPPGANPAMVGKKFKLIYNEADELIEIKPAY